MKAVTALIGRLPSKPGILAIRLQNILTIMPINIVAGIRILWSLLLKINLVRCGIANPKKAIGPQYAVTMAVKYPETRIIIMLFLLTFNPKFSAYKSPKSKIFRFLHKNKLTKSPMMIHTEKNKIFDGPTAENVPIPQMTKA